MCTNGERILGYVYGELPEADRRVLEAHLATCADCRGEVAGLRTTRGHLAAWTPPEPDFGFRIIRGSQAAAPPRRWWPAPAWGLAAAAVLVLAAAAAIANIEVRYDASGLVVRTGWARAAAAPQAASRADSGVAQVAVTPEQWRSQMAALEARLVELERTATRESASGTQLASGPRMSDADIIRRVRDIVGQSETRQQREFAMQIAQVLRDVDRARQLDFLQIRQTLGQHRAQTSADVAKTLNYYVTRVSQEK
jgi:anti-sigma factor RsiW